MIWDQLVDCQKAIIQMFDAHGTEINEPGMEHFNQSDGGWINQSMGKRTCSQSSY